MEEKVENTVNDEQTSTSEANAETETDPKSDNGSGSFTRRLRERKSAKRAARSSARLDLFCFILILVFASYFKASHYVGQKTTLLYYYENANVIDVREVTVTNEDTEKEEDRWRVTISYDVGSTPHRKYLYYKKNPAYEVGDVLSLKIQTINPDNIEVDGIAEGAESITHH